MEDNETILEENEPITKDDSSRYMPECGNGFTGLPVMNFDAYSLNLNL